MRNNKVKEYLRRIERMKKMEDIGDTLLLLFVGIHE